MSRKHVTHVAALSAGKCRIRRSTSATGPPSPAPSVWSRDGENKIQLSIGDLATKGPALSTVHFYDDSIPAGWNNWSSWMAHDLASTAVVHSGANSISITPTAWGGVSLQNGSGQVDTSAFRTLMFRVHGGNTGGHYTTLCAPGFAFAAAACLPACDQQPCRLLLHDVP